MVASYSRQRSATRWAIASPMSATRYDWARRWQISRLSELALLWALSANRACSVGGIRNRRPTLRRFGFFRVMLDCPAVVLEAWDAGDDQGELDGGAAVGALHDLGHLAFDAIGEFFDCDHVAGFAACDVGCCDFVEGIGVSAGFVDGAHEGGAVDALLGLDGATCWIA